MNFFGLLLTLGTLVVWFPVYGAECPATLPNMSDPEGALPSSTSHGWYGSDNLAALIPKHGQWVGMGLERNYGDKFWWWRQGYNTRNEARPKLSVSRRRLDISAPLKTITNTTSGYGDNWNSMLVGMEFPTSGCWEIIGTYHEHQLKIILNVGRS